MNGPEVLVPIAFFFTVVALGLGIPLIRAYIRKQERAAFLPPADPHAAERLARIEAAVESIALEVERISEGQRFTTRLLSERSSAAAAPAPKSTEPAP